MRHWIKKHWKWAAPAAAVVIGAGAWLVFGFFGLHLIFVDDKVDEAPPLFASGAGVSGLPSDFITEERAEAMNQVMAEENIPTEIQASEELPMGVTELDLDEMVAARPAEPVEPSSGADPGQPGPVATLPGPAVTAVLVAPPTDSPDSAEPPATTVPEVRIAASGNFISRSHPTEGSAVVLTDGSQRFLRFENFKTDNGPDLNVYLSNAPTNAPAGQFDDDFIDLGDLKGNIGSQNYEIPADVDLDTYSTVVIWCVRFSVIFGAAELAAS